MKKIIYITAFFLLVSFTDKELKLLYTINLNADFFTTDNLGNTYIVEGSLLKKFDTYGNLIHTFSDKTRGNIFSIDAGNPLKILVFYKDFRQIVFLNSNLTITGDPIILDDLGVSQPQLVCNSYDNNFWIYDQQDFCLKRFDKNLEITAQSNNITIAISDIIKPSYLEEYGDFLYLYDSAKGILVFDIFGTYSKIYPFQNISSFQPLNQNIYYSSDSLLFKYHPKSFSSVSIKLPDLQVKKIRISGNNILIQTPKAINAYQMVPENIE